MATNKNISSDPDTVAEEVRETVESGDDIQASVRRITLKALAQGELDADGMRRVAHAVADGARQGAVTHGPDASEALTKAISGLDEALAKAAETMKLALEEATGQAKEFSSHDVRRTFDDLKGLEALFFETLNQAAKGGHDLASETLRNMIDHTQRSGSAVGAQVKQSLEQLGEKIAEVEKAHLVAGVETARTTGALLSRVAAGMLAGLADSLHPDANSQSKKKPSTDDD